MAKAKTLTQFRVSGSGDTFSLHIEDDGGETIEFQATRDQLDVIAESLEETLSEDVGRRLRRGLIGNVPRPPAVGLVLAT